MYTNMFDAEHVKSLPPEQYQLRVLKLLVSRLEGAIEDPEEDVRHPSHHYGPPAPMEFSQHI
jgi:hypothetical protein